MHPQRCPAYQMTDLIFELFAVCVFHLARAPLGHSRVSCCNLAITAIFKWRILANIDDWPFSPPFVHIIWRLWVLFWCQAFLFPQFFDLQYSSLVKFLWRTNLTFCYWLNTLFFSWLCCVLQYCKPSQPQSSRLSISWIFCWQLLEPW